MKRRIDKRRKMLCLSTSPAPGSPTSAKEDDLHLLMCICESLLQMYTMTSPIWLRLVIASLCHLKLVLLKNVCCSYFYATDAPSEMNIWYPSCPSRWKTWTSVICYVQHALFQQASGRQALCPCFHFSYSEKFMKKWSMQLQNFATAFIIGFNKAQHNVTLVWHCFLLLLKTAYSKFNKEILH